MRIYKLDKKNNFIELEPETLDDLWTLNIVLSEQDLIGSKSTRRFRVEGSKDSEKKTVFVNINLEKKVLDMQKGCLKVSGIIVSGSPEEYVDLNSYHSVEIMLGTKIAITKQRLLSYEIKLLEKSKKNALLPKIYLVVVDDDSSLIAKVNVRQYDLVAEIKSGKAGKRLDSAEYRNKYFSEVYETLAKQEKDLVIIAGPGFEKEYFKTFLSSKSDAKKFRFTHVNTTGITGLNELLKGGNLNEVLDEFRLQKDTELINNLFKEIARDGAICYGAKEVEAASASGALKELIVTDKYFMENYNKTRELLSELEANSSEHHIIASNTEAGKLLDNIGGIAGFLYYKNTK